MLIRHQALIIERIHPGKWVILEKINFVILAATCILLSNQCSCLNYTMVVLHLWTLHSKKKKRVKLDPERVHWGQIPFLVKDDPEIGQLSADLKNNGVSLTLLWVIFRVRLTDFRVIVEPEWSFAPMDPFRVKFDPGVRYCRL